jgi:hypothetical protein
MMKPQLHHAGAAESKRRRRKCTLERTCSRELEQGPNDDPRVARERACSRELEPRVSQKRDAKSVVST